MPDANCSDAGVSRSKLAADIAASRGQGEVVQARLTTELMKQKELL
jgi:hypothetical protein